ncbi:MAG: glycosyltransferase family 1 protein [Nitrospirota bacterium]|nr:glycosyltransferase family 1 protein [Nitrospirota bacterium]
MNIAINTLSITPQRGGGKTYLTNIIKNLAEIDKDNVYYLFVSYDNESLFNIKEKNFKKIRFPLYSDNKILKILIEQFLLFFYIKRHKVDVLFSPGNFATIYSSCRQVLVIQGPLIIREIRKKHAPNEISWIRRLYYDVMLPVSVGKADKIIAVSNDMKRSLLKQINIPELKIRVIHEGVDLAFVNSRENPEYKSSLQKPYILFLSTLFKYKNADKLLKAFAMLKHDRRIPHSLMIVGRDPDDETEKLKKIVEQEKLTDSVVFAGAVPHEEIALVYENADMFVYPSSVETFGLPVLEAMACGTPVVASNRMSVPEIGGDAALIVDPDNVSEMSEAIYRIIIDEKLKKTLIKKGYKRVRQFTWEKTAQETLEVFREVHSSVC